MFTQPIITLAVLDDHSLFRKLLVDFLSSQKNIIIKIETDNAIELLEKLKTSPVNIVLLDLFMPKLNGIDAVTILRNQFPDIKIIIVTLCTDLNIVKGFLDLGIHAYISKEEEPQNLLQAIHFANENRIYRNTLFTEALYMDKEKKIRKGGKKPDLNLSDREKKIIQLLWEEKSNKEIASSIYLSVSSIEKIKQELKERLGVKSIAGLFKYALQHGIISIQKIILDSSFENY